MEEENRPRTAYGIAVRLRNRECSVVRHRQVVDHLR